MDPLNLPGPDFLALYVLLAMSALALGFFLRWLLRTPGGSPDVLPQRLDPYEIAMLSGPKAVVHTALARLLHQKALVMDGTHLTTTGKRSDFASHFERLVYAAVHESKKSNAELIASIEPALERLKSPLQQRGWLVDEGQATRARWLPMLPMLGVLLLGLAKINVGLEREKPVSLLVFLCLVTAGSLFFLTGRVWTSRRGAALLRALRWNQQPLKMSTMSADTSQAMNSQDLGVAVALFGLGAVAMSDFELMRRHIDPSGSSFSGSSSSSSCSSSSCSSSDGGGGGGGCGGCGGGGD
ncbi:TIGR04222 domain-containing membrane protein [Myxococcus fulvus]|uniref:TIGR04222 domain-containing membrane protein n=1 Tax=Myxococcus fulvus TaxID=33 RepID=UPI003B9C01BF